MEFTADTFVDMPHIKGPLVAGYIITSILYGVSIMSFISYLQFSQSTDRKLIRALAWSMAIVATVTMTFSVVKATRHFAYRFGVAPNVIDARFDSASFLLGGVAHVLAAGFFAMRAWRIFGRPIYLGVILSLLLLTTTVGSLGAAITGMASDMRSQREDIFNYLLFISIVVGDVTITLLITIKLYRSKTGWARTDSLIHNLVVLAIEAQMPPALTAIAFLITYIAAPLSYTLAFSCMPMIYVLSLFAALQSRHIILVKMGPEQDYSAPHRTLSISAPVTTETYTHSNKADISLGEERGAGRPAGSTETVQTSPRDYNSSTVRLV